MSIVPFCDIVRPLSKWHPEHQIKEGAYRDLKTWATQYPSIKILYFPGPPAKIMATCTHVIFPNLMITMFIFNRTRREKVQVGVAKIYGHNYMLYLDKTEGWSQTIIGTPIFSKKVKKICAEQRFSGCGKNEIHFLERHFSVEAV